MAHIILFCPDDDHVIVTGPTESHPKRNIPVNHYHRNGLPPNGVDVRGHAAQRRYRSGGSCPVRESYGQSDSRANCRTGDVMFDVKRKLRIRAHERQRGETKFTHLIWLHLHVYVILQYVNDPHLNSDTDFCVCVCQRFANF